MTQSPAEPARDDAAIDAALLHTLLAADAACTIDSLASRFGWSHDHTRHEIDRLRTAGCDISVDPQAGIRLEHSGTGAWVDYLQARVTRPHGITVYASTRSTQEPCRTLISTRGRAADGAVVIADHQTAGRGRLGRAWIAPRGKAVTFSMVYAPADADTNDAVTLRAAVGIARAVERATQGRIRAQIKWPNDVLVEGHKLAGILVESFGGVMVIGVGVNVAVEPSDLPADDAALRARVTSLAMCGHARDRLSVLEAAIDELDRALADADEGDVLDEWRARSVLLSQAVRVQSDGRVLEGHVVDIDPQLGLIFRTHDGVMLHLRSQTTTILAADG